MALPDRRTGPNADVGTLAAVLSDLLRPFAIVTHLLVLAVAVTCVALGQWQFDRLAQVRDSNALLEERLRADPVELATLVDADDPGRLDAEALEFRRVEVVGTYRPDEEVLQRNRDHVGQQGFHTLTPLELPDGVVVLVRRGWVPAQLSDPPVEEALPPVGEVVVRGLLEKPVPQPGFGPRDPDDGVLERVFHTDTTRLDRQVEGTLFRMVLRLEEQQPATAGDLPLSLERPVLDEANHLSYALQWYAFAAIALITYGFWLRSRHRRRRTRDRSPAEVAVPG